MLRYKTPDMHRPFKVRYPRFVGVMAVALSGMMVVMYLIPGTQSSLVMEDWVILGGWTLLRTLFCFISRWKYQDEFGKVEGE